MLALNTRRKPSGDKACAGTEGKGIDGLTQGWVFASKLAGAGPRAVGEPVNDMAISFQLRSD